MTRLSLVLMNTSVQVYETSTYDLSSEINWTEYYPRLLAVARRLVYMYRIPAWYGQEENLAEDVTQETVRRMLERIQKAYRKEAPPINSPEHMAAIIARNYVLDLRRHDYRMVRLSADNDTYDIGIDTNELESMSEIVTEHVYHEWLFLQVALEIAHLPSKQRKAILIDLANLTSFNTEPAPLQAALLAVGIDLQEHQQPLFENPVERARHASLLSLAYKRVTQITCAKLLLSAA